MPEPRRLAFCITELDPGGAERALVQLVTRLPRDEWAAKVYCLSGPGDLVAPLRDAGIPVDCLGARSKWSWGVVRELTRRLREQRPVLLQTFLYHANLTGRWAAWRAGVPIVVSGLRVAERDAPWRMKLDRWTQRLVTHNVAVSQGVADFVVREVGFNPAKVSVIPNGVDADRFSEAPPVDWSRFGIPGEARVIAFIGRLHRQKGPDLLLEAASPLMETDSSIHLVVVGEGPMGDALRRRARESAAAERVHFVGRQTDVAGILRASAVCVAPSRWEGMPNVILESMAAGCPVVASDVEGSRELIADRQSGWLFPRESVADLSRAISECLGDPARAAKLAQTAQHFVQKDLTVNAMVRAYECLYDRLTGRRANVDNSAGLVPAEKKI